MALMLYECRDGWVARKRCVEGLEGRVEVSEQLASWAEFRQGSVVQFADDGAICGGAGGFAGWSVHQVECMGCRRVWLAH